MAELEYYYNYINEDVIKTAYDYLISLKIFTEDELNSYYYTDILKLININNLISNIMGNVKYISYKNSNPYPRNPIDEIYSKYYCNKFILKDIHLSNFTSTEKNNLKILNLLHYNFTSTNENEFHKRIDELAIRKLYKYKLFIIQTDINNSLLLKIQKLEKKNEELTERYLKTLPNYP
jgi:hypothetical protein